MKRSKSVNSKKDSCRSTLICVLCKQNLLQRCLECRIGQHAGSCWVILDNKNGYRHTHCAITKEGWQPK